MKSKYILIWIGGAVLAGGFTGLLGARLYLKYNSQPIILDMLKGYFSSNKFMDNIYLIQPDVSDLKNNFIVIKQKQGGETIKIWHSPAAPIWKIFLTDVDNDGKNELAVCLFKSEKYDPQKDNRLQIYGWGINGIYAKWRGTFLCHPFKKVIFTDVNGDGKTELLSLEEYKNQKYLSIYHWNGFGFDLISQKRIGEEIDDASLVEKTGRHP